MYRMQNAAKGLLLSVCLFIGICSGCHKHLFEAATGRDNVMIFPDKEWQQGTPQDFGFNKVVLNALDEQMKYHRANGVLIRNGHLIAEWNYGGPSDKKFMVQSVSKSITSMMLGLAVREGLIPSIDASVKDYWPDFEAGPYTDKITFRQLSNMTSGMATVRWYGLEFTNPGNIEPGTQNYYHNDQPQALARALTYLFGKTLQEVLQEKALNDLQADMEWEVDKDESMMKAANGKNVAVNYGHAKTHWNARDLAKVGHLYLNHGMWKNKRILPESFARETFNDIPLTINKWITDKRITTQTPERLAGLGYGLAWWTRRDKEVAVWYMSGFGDQVCMVLPDYGVVFVKVNDWQTPEGVFVSELPKIGTPIIDTLCNWAVNDIDMPIDDEDFIAIKDEGFVGQMSRYEITNAQYVRFLNEALEAGDIIVNDSHVKGATGSYTGQDYYRLDGPGLNLEGATNGGASRIRYSEGTFTVENGFEDHPVTYVSWYGAMAFADYYGWRLPTEGEWQAVADYDGGYSYGCGPTINTNIANYHSSRHPYGTTPVGEFGVYGYGMADMAGNVWEWTSSFWLPGSSFPVFRGGSWFYSASHCDVSLRINRSPTLMNNRLGFRICR